ncbi:MAG: hypothetical protein ACP5I3_12560, partial [Thermoproteus sp.]
CTPPETALGGLCSWAFLVVSGLSWRRRGLFEEPLLHSRPAISGLMTALYPLPPSTPASALQPPARRRPPLYLQASQRLGGLSGGC